MPTGAGRSLELMGVSITAISLLDEFPCDLYRLEDATGKPTLYRSRAIRAKPEDLAKLVANGEQTLHVPVVDFQRCHGSMKEQLAHYLERSEIPATQRLEILITLVHPTIRRSFSTLSTEQAVEESLRIGQQVTTVLGQNEVAATEVFHILGHDQFTFTHVVNVASYAVLLAERLGMRDSSQLAEIAIAGLLHDVGKRFIPAKILQKKGPLTAAERESVQTHPTRGYQELLRVGGMTHAQLMIAYQHHERLDGKGYPVGIRGNDIHPLARLCAVVDVFDALTCRRPYRDPMSAAAALELMSRQSGKQFDGEMLQCWQSMMQPN